MSSSFHTHNLIIPVCQESWQIILVWVWWLLVQNVKSKGCQKTLSIMLVMALSNLFGLVYSVWIFKLIW